MHSSGPRLFLRDAGTEFEDVRYPFDDSWAATSAWLREKGISRTGRVPALEYHGTILTEVCSTYYLAMLSNGCPAYPDPAVFSLGTGRI